MPDKWEYPWYAAWDLAFHCVPLALVDPDFAKRQLKLLLREWYMHPNGQIPAYEWAFGDVNPPVHAWAAWRVYKIEKRMTGKGDLVFLEKVFHKLLLNFTWWVNRKDTEGRNVFQGGFLGLDNIGVFDRSAQLPTGGYIEQSDGTSWMAMYCLNLLAIAMELGHHNASYEDVASKFFEHFMYIAHAINHRRAVERGGRLLLRRAPPSRRRRAPARGAVDGRPDPALRGRDGRRRRARAPAALPQPPRVVRAQPARPERHRRADQSRRRRQAADSQHHEPGPAATRAALHARRDGVPGAARDPLAVALSSEASVHARRERHGALHSLRAGGVADRAFRRQLELARSDLVPAQFPDHRVAAEISTTTTATR